MCYPWGSGAGPFRSCKRDSDCALLLEEEGGSGEDDEPPVTKDKRRKPLTDEQKRAAAARRKANEKKKSDKIVRDAEAAMMDWFKDFLRNNVPGAEDGRAHV